MKQGKSIFSIDIFVLIALIGICFMAVCARAETPNWPGFDARARQYAAIHEDATTRGTNDERLLSLYYDFAQGYEYLSRRLSDPSLLTWAERGADWYVNNYATPSGFTLPGYWIFTNGLTRLNSLQANTTYRNAVFQLSTLGSYCRDTTPINETLDPALSRETSYCMRAMMDAERLGYPRRPRLFTLMAHAQSHLDQWFVSHTAAFVRPFMVGLTARALIDYNDHIQEVPGIRARLTHAANEMKVTLWIESARAFRYTDRVINAGDMDPAPDLNMLIAPLYAWLGDKEFAGKVFNGGVEQAWLGGPKQFNQFITWAEDFERFYAATPSPSPTPTLTPTPSITPTLTPSPTPTSSPTPSSTPSVVPTPSPSVSPLPTVSPTPTPTPLPTVVPTPCQRPAKMDSIKKLDKYEQCRIDRLKLINGWRE